MNFITISPVLVNFHSNLYLFLEDLPQLHKLHYCLLATLIPYNFDHFIDDSYMALFYGLYYPMYSPLLLLGSRFSTAKDVTSSFNLTVHKD